MQHDWLALVLTLPTSPSAVRVRIWRALKASGCGALRDGVYLLPEQSRLRARCSTALAARGAAGRRRGHAARHSPPATRSSRSSSRRCSTAPPSTRHSSVDLRAQATRAARQRRRCRDGACCARSHSSSTRCAAIDFFPTASAAPVPPPRWKTCARECEARWSPGEPPRSSGRDRHRAPRSRPTTRAGPGRRGAGRGSTGWRAPGWSPASSTRRRASSG